MSHSHLIPTSSYNFQVKNALKLYQERTKKNLLSHPLSVQLKAIDSPDTIIAVLHEQARGLSQPRSGDNPLTRWLNQTVQILYTLSVPLGDGVGLVSLRT